MKKGVKITISCLVTLALTVGMLAYLTDVLERKDSRAKYADFFDESQNMDVLFVGSSHVLYGVSPLDIWNNHGITSYNFGGYACHPATSYWIMENALDYTTPKVVVIDGFLVSKENKCSDNLMYLHLSLDAFPISLTKVKTVMDLFNDEKDDIEDSDDDDDDEIETFGGPEVKEEKSDMGFLWDYAVYHSRWSELKESDFVDYDNCYKGAEIRMGLSPQTYERVTVLKGDDYSYDVGEEYLEKMIEDCKSRGIEVLLTYLPFNASARYQEEVAYLYDFAEKHDVKYINFLDEEVTNFKTDFFDDGHMNFSGMRKVSDYLGNYLEQNYNLEDHRSDEKYSSWNEDYATYLAEKIESLKLEKDLDDYLVMLSDDDYLVFVKVDNPYLLLEENVADLLVNLGYMTDMDVHPQQIDVATGEVDFPAASEFDDVFPLSETGDIRVMVYSKSEKEMIDAKVF